MAKKKGSDTLRQQRFAREEFLKLKKMQQGELEPEPKPSEVAVKLSFKEKLKNIWYHDKIAIISVTFIIVAVAFFIAQCVSKPKYDMTVVVFSHEIAGDVNCDKMAEYLKQYCDDINGDGEVNINVINCSINIENDADQYSFANRNNVTTYFTDATAMLYITDESSYKEMTSNEKDVPIFEGEPLKFGEDFYEFCEDDGTFSNLPKGLQISCRNLDGAQIANDKNADDYYDNAQAILKGLKDNQ